MWLFRFVLSQRWLVGSLRLIWRVGSRPWLLMLASAPIAAVGVLVRDYISWGAGVILMSVGYFCLLGPVLAVILVTTIVSFDEPDSRISQPENIKPIMLNLLFLVLLIILPPLLVALATSGSTIDWVPFSGEQSSSNSLASFVSQWCLMAFAALLLVAPLTLRTYMPWDGASETARKVIPAWLGATSAVVTWLYIFMLHFERGPLAGTKAGPLAVAALGAATLLEPVYHSAARVFWQRDIGELFNPWDWWIKWCKLRQEFKRSFGQKPSSEIAQKDESRASDPGPAEAPTGGS